MAPTLRCRRPARASFTSLPGGCAQTFGMPPKLFAMIRTLATVLVVLSMAPSANAQPRRPSGAVAAVAKLYQDFAAEAVIDSAELSVEDLFGRPRAMLAKYLDDSLVALVLRDRECSRRSQGICNLDFAPIWDSQDPVGTTVKISEASDPTRVVVELRYFERPEVRRLTYRMVKSPAGWRVADIEYSTHQSLVSLLRGKP